MVHVTAAVSGRYFLDNNHSALLGSPSFEEPLVSCSLHDLCVYPVCLHTTISFNLRSFLPGGSEIVPVVIMMEAIQAVLVWCRVRLWNSASPATLKAICSLTDSMARIAQVPWLRSQSYLQHPSAMIIPHEPWNLEEDPSDFLHLLDQNSVTTPLRSGNFS